MELAARNVTNQPDNREFFAGNGEMATLMRELDWSATPVGPTEAWPQSLKTAVRIMLTSRYAMWMGWGPEVAFLYNDSYGQMTLGKKHPWALGKPAREVWAEIWADIDSRIETVYNNGEATWDEALMLFLERNGYPEETYHTFSYSPLADDSGQISGMLCVVTEETERIISERRMALLRDAASALASAQTVEGVFASIAQCIEADARDFPFTLAYLFDGEASTARLVRTTGIPADHPLAAPLIGLHAAATPWPLEDLRASAVPVRIDNLTEWFPALPSGPWNKPPQQAIIVPITHPGQERPAGFLVAAINPYRLFDADYMGFVNLLVGQINSRLANAQAYEEEKRRAEALAELDRAKTTFFNNVSHEFRTPLTLMLGPMEDALTGAHPLSGDNLQSVHRNGLRLLKLVNTLLDFSRIEAGRVQASYKPTDLAVYTAELASVFRSAIEKAGMRLRVDCPPLSELAYVDRDMWEKVVLNLLSNSFKFTLEGEIAVTLCEENGKAILAVRDTGTGITEEQLPHVFERFHRVEGVRARTHEGTGIGLALVQELVRLHGGTVGVESVYGEGTTFTVSIPLGSTHLPTERISAPTTLSSTALRAGAFIEEAQRWLSDGSETAFTPSDLTANPLLADESVASERQAHILLADDNADMREYVLRLLRPQYRITAVANGEQALEAIRQERPDLVLSDVMMPILDGFGVLREIRSDPRTASLPVILLSARAGEEARIEGLSAGADDYLTKPFAARELLARIGSHLELARVRSEAEQTIRESEERFRVALSNVPLTVYTCDRELRFTWIANPASDFAADQILGKRDEDIRPGGELADFTVFKQRVLDSGQGAREEISYVTPSGTIYFDMTAEPLRDREGEIIGLTVAAFDITTLKSYELNLAQVNARLQRAMTETHHRVKNNLQLMSALIDMQRASGAESVPMSQLTRLGSNVRALGVIHDILTQEAKGGNDQETLPAREVLTRLVEVLEQTAGGRPITFNFQDARLEGKQTTALALIANELISNALKHSAGAIEIDFRVKGSEATLEVCDDGSGFPIGFDAQTAANTGLELVENVARWDLRGEIAYTNRREGGARIIVTFPITAQKQ